MGAPTRITVAPTRFAFAHVSELAGADPGEYVDAQSYDDLSAAHYCALEALAEDPSKWSFRTLVHIAELILESDYPAECFTGESGEPGAVLVARLREAIDAIDVASFPSPVPASNDLAEVRGAASGSGGDQSSSCGAGTAQAKGENDKPAEDTPAGAPPAVAGDGSTPPRDGASAGGSCVLPAFLPHSIRRGRG